MFPRLLQKKLPQNASFFLFGPRQTGKTTLLSNLPVTLFVDLLERERFLNYKANPDQLYDEVTQLSRKGAASVWLDEVQKVPELLETVHRCMNHFPNIQFILSGSSARKLKRGAANLLGGRALNLTLHPLTVEELGEAFSLKKALHFGTLPHIYSYLDREDYQLAQQFLKSYVTTYLTEEIHEEALVQHLDHFQNFLKIAASFTAQQVNLTALAAKACISQHFVRKYFSILEDTLIGFLLDPYIESPSKRMSKQPKCYLFDNGVTCAIRGHLGRESVGAELGALYEQFVVQEVKRLVEYEMASTQLYFWRTAAGAEVDLVLVNAGEIVMAIECKSQPQLSKKDFSGLAAFSKVHPRVPLYLCAPVLQARESEDGVMILPIQELLKEVRKRISFAAMFI